MKLLGIVREVAPDYAVVSLPSMLTGFIRRDSNSGIRLDHVVSVGTTLPVVVLRATSETIKERSSNGGTKPVVKRRIEVTLSPVAVNGGLNNEMLFEGMCVRGRIRSVEDHGCLVDLSINGISGTNCYCFVKNENIEGGYEVLDDSDDDDEHADDDDDEDKEMKTSKSKGDKFILNKGRVYDFTISSLPSKKTDANSSRYGSLSIIQLKLEKAESRAKAVTDPSLCRKSKQTIRSLCPGILLKVEVEHFARNGLCVTFMGSVYRGAIDSNNLGGYLPEDFDGKDKKSSSGPNDMWWKSVFVGKFKAVNARLITGEDTTKVGEIIENTRVIRLDSGVGALLALPSDDNDDDEDEDDENDSKKKKKKKHGLLSNPIYQTASKIRCAYVHISKAIDNDKSRTPEALFAKKFAVNTKIPKLRITSSSNWMDDIASCATAASIVSSAVLTHTDLRAGTIYRAVPVIANLDNGGVLVQLGIGVKGLIPAMHLFDKSVPIDGGNTSYRNKVRMEKYKVGNKIDVRCLMISPSERKCVLTAKKGLISTDSNDPITDYSKIETGRTATGFISRVSKQGIAITFYNNVFGRISARKLAEEMGVEDPTVDYKMGDVIKVKVSRCFKKGGRDMLEEKEDYQDSYILNLSLNLLTEDGDAAKGGNSSHLIGLLEPGMILKSKSLKIVELVSSRNREDNTFLPGHAIVSIKSKHLPAKEGAEVTEKGSITCKLPYEHILDSHDAETTQSPESMDALASKVLTVGKKIAQEAIILSVTNRHGSVSTPILSLKPTLIATAKDNLDNKSPDALLPKPSTALFMGAYVRGYCVRLHPSYGAFIRFLGGLTAIVPKLKGGLEIGLYNTVLCKIVAMDVMSGKAPKILLKQVLKSRLPK